MPRHNNLSRPFKFFVMKQSDDTRTIPATSIASGKGYEVTSDVYYFTDQIVNVIMLSGSRPGSWVLVDTGMPERADKIIEAIEERFGKDSHPECIVLTHGHFDHTGNIVKLVNRWNVPV